jgi:hypothetical protein
MEVSAGIGFIKVPGLGLFLVGEFTVSTLGEDPPRECPAGDWKGGRTSELGPLVSSNPPLPLIILTD